MLWATKAGAVASEAHRVCCNARVAHACRVACLQNLMVTLESSAVHDREDLKREQLRLSREAARVEAATSSLQAERDDLRVQVRRGKSRMPLWYGIQHCLRPALTATRSQEPRGSS